MIKHFPYIITYLTFYLYFFTRHNRFPETHSYVQFSYQITDRLLVAGKNAKGDYIYLEN